MSSLVPKPPTLRGALETAILTANEAYAAWHAVQDQRVGSLLAALSGRLKGYSAEIDAMHTALADDEGNHEPNS